MNATIAKIAGTTLLALAGNCFAVGGLSVSREATIDSSPDTVWKLVGGFNALDVWHPAIKGSKLTGNGTRAGAMRLLDLGGGATVSEKLTAYNAAKHSYSYMLLKAPLPVKNYAATIVLSPTADGKTLMKWSSSFDAAGAPDDQVTEIIQGLYDAGLAKVVANFAKQ
ncbi:SRPBCC family protein [Methylibium sp.]|uniref:SRPBCC family protein n=1 Tax=Methylibium sp. TaxID=2067992 RepID=UPI00286B8C5D|nr:SRPBCC family protein [Methylibium sp.]